MHKIFITIFLFVLGLCGTAFGQTATLTKFEFMKGEFKIRGSKDGILKAVLNKNGDEFSWTIKSTLDDEYGVITVDALTNSYHLTEKLDSYTKPFYYIGNETNEGFHFFELTAANGVIAENGNEVLIRPLEREMFQIEHFYNYYGKDKPKQWVPSEYYSKNLALETLDKQVRFEIGKLDFLVGRFVADDGMSEFNGKFTNDGKELVWNFSSPEKTSRAVITYDFHWDSFTMKEEIDHENGENDAVTYGGSMNREEVTLAMFGRIDGVRTEINFSPLSKDKVLILFKKYDETPKKEIIYSKVQ